MLQFCQEWPPLLQPLAVPGKCFLIFQTHPMSLLGWLSQTAFSLQDTPPGSHKMLFSRIYFSHHLYWFPGAAVPNYHRLGGLKQQEAYSSQFLGPGAYTWTKIRCQQGHTPSPEVPERMCSCFFHSLGATAILGLWPHHFNSASTFTSSPLCVFVSSLSTFLL